MAQPTSPVTPSLVFVPNLRTDRGMGHLKRCLGAARSAGSSSVVYLAAEFAFVGKFPLFSRSVVQTLADQAGVTLWDHWPPGLSVPTVVVDLQATTEAAFRFLRDRCVRLVGWDEGGRVRGRFPFLVDSLPHDTQPLPNVRLPELLGLGVPPRAPLFQRPVQRVLAAFGGADSRGLTLKFLTFVKSLQGQGRWPYSLTVVRGPLSKVLLPPDTEVLEAPSNLAGLLGGYDLTVTSWGLTALESLAAGTPVVLLNPTSYHEKLARAAGLPTFGVGRPRVQAFWSGVEEAPEAARVAFGKLLRPPQDSGAYFAAFHGSDGFCPVCRTSGHPVFARTVHKSYHRCEECGMEYLSVHQLPEKQYSEAYFFEDYQKQYGKTYLQDFPHIQGLGRERLAFLDKTFGAQEGRSVLDVGCAYGPFLAAVALAGHRPYGLDVADAAVDHVKTALGFPAVRASFLDFRWQEAFPGHSQPDVLTLWYVIEHFPNLDALLRQANSVLSVGGIFAFSTPNGRGITRRFAPEKFWRESPDDHFSIWNPRNSRSVLGRFGFEVAAYRVTGHHPERFPGLKNPRGMFFALIRVLDRWLGWGDTFEVYARKTKELP